MSETANNTQSPKPSIPKLGFRSDPKFPDLGPGRMHRLRRWPSFYEGTDIETKFEKTKKTGWRKQP
jgi:hypothetical protein